MPTKTQHLQRRGAVYHWRRRLPAPLNQILSSTHWNGSLRTADPALARCLARRLSVAFDLLLEHLRSMPPELQPTPGQLNLILKDLFDSILKDGERRRSLLGPEGCWLPSGNREQIINGDADEDTLATYRRYREMGVFDDELPEEKAWNWTGRLPVTGTPLLALVLSWLAGRIAILFSDQLGLVVTAIADFSFLTLLSLVIGREVLAGRNWRNLKVLILVALFLCGNALFHAETAGNGTASSGYGTRLGIAVAVFLIMLIGGRIVPSFTRNWLARRGPGRLPVPFNRFDLVSMIIAAAALLLWTAAPDRTGTDILCLVAGGLHVWRVAWWAGDRTPAEPLVLILHVGYAFVPLGFLAAGCAVLSPAMIPMSAALHAWTAGAIGVMTLAVMTRASLGHVGKPLHATPGTVLVYLCVIAAAVLRIASGLGLAPEALLHLAAAAWIAAFAGFAILFGPLLVRARQSH